MKYFSLLFIVCALSFNGSTQTFDNGLVIYDSKFEEKAFADLDNATPLELLMSIGFHATDKHFEEAKTEIQRLKKILEKKGFATSDAKKQAKMLEGLLHGKLLKNYKEISPFFHIFYDGEFNCVSSSALYALLLDEFNIPYTIIELPTHVYVVMYPNGTRVKVETTAPKKGYVTATDSQVEKTMNSLIQLRVVTKKWVESKGMRAAYNEHFFHEEGISLRDLTGLQYYNECVVDMNQGDVKEALSQIMKAQRIYDGEQLRFLKIELLDMKLSSLEIETLDDFAIFEEYANTENTEVDKVEYRYAIFLQQILLLKGNKSLVDSAFVYLLDAIKDSTMLGIIKETHYLGLAEYYSNANNQKRSTEYAIKCLEVNMGNKYAQMAVTRSVLNELSDFESEYYLGDYFNDMTEEEFEEYMEDDALTDGELIEQMLAGYIERFPFLEDNELFKTMYFYVYADFSETAFSDDDEVEGEKFFDKALKVMESLEDQELIDEFMYGMMFSSAGAYYYGEHKYEKALGIVNEGLEFAPDHPRLLAKRKIIERVLEKD